MAAYDGTYKARLGKMFDGSNPVVWSVPEAASQTFLEGEFVYRNAGFLTGCGADPADILGIALEAGNNGAEGANNILVLVATEVTGYEIPVHSGTPASSDVEDADLGVKYGIAAVSNNWYVDKDDTSATRLRIQQFKDAVGTVNGTVIATILPGNREVS